MPYPPTVPPSNRTDPTPQATNHPSDHNALSKALTDIINELGADPSSAGYATVQARLDALKASLDANTAAIAAANANIAAANANIAGNTAAINSHTASINATNNRVQGGAVQVTTDANGGFGISFNAMISGGASVSAFLSTQNPGLMNTCLTLYNADAWAFSAIARRGDGVPVANTGLTIHWQTS
jgi:hypothetical protein